MTREEMHHQCNLVSLSDEALKETLGYFHMSAHKLEEQHKNDPELAAMKQRVKDLEDERYKIAIKSYKANLKAARALAEARGITWHPPKGTES